jgi:hypothetical protein
MILSALLNVVITKGKAIQKYGRIKISIKIITIADIKNKTQYKVTDSRTLFICKNFMQIYINHLFNKINNIATEIYHSLSQNYDVNFSSQNFNR